MKKSINIIKNKNKVEIVFKFSTFPNVTQIKKAKDEYNYISKKVKAQNNSMETSLLLKIDDTLNRETYIRIITLLIASLEPFDRKKLCTKKPNFDFNKKTLGFRIDEIYLDLLKPTKKYIEEMSNAFGAKLDVIWINDPDLNLRKKLEVDEKTRQQDFEIASTKAIKNTHSTPKKQSKKLLRISEVKKSSNNSKVSFFARIENIEEKNHYTITAEDETGSIIVQTYKIEHKQLMKQFKKGSAVRFNGSYKKDPRRGSMVWFQGVQEASVSDVFEEPEDTCEVKRFELHTHTKMSDMDGVASVEDYYEKLKRWGHKGMAITDHDSVQAFPEASKIQKKDKDFKFIFGVELTCIEPTIKELAPMTIKKEDATFIVYDIETTGLYAYINEVIEISMRKINYLGHEIEPPIHMFLKPDYKPSKWTLEFTGIKEKDLEEGVSKKEAAEKIYDFITSSKNPVLVAHNATFDNSFLSELIKEELNKPITTPTIDTLSLAKEIIDKQRSYALGAVAKSLKISYDQKDAHRADYDTDVLGRVLVELFNLANKTNKSINMLCEQYINNYWNWERRHLIVLAKNLKGKKRVYELTSLGLSKYLMRGPSVPFAEVDKERENILVGSACSNGFVFQAALQGNDERLSKWISKMDFIEIQPPRSYSHLMEEDCFDIELIKKVIRKIVIQAKKQKKVIVATSDSHYVSERDKILRDVYINTEGLFKTRHPFYRNLKTKLNPDILIDGPEQVYMSTNDMISELEFLSDLVNVDEIVVKNSNFIADQCENYKIQPEGVFTPNIKGLNIDEWVEKKTYETATKLYGSKIPDFVETRLKKELKLLKENKFNFIYYISALVVKKVSEEDKDVIVGSRGSVGSSAVANFIGITEVNPLPPHYSCKECSYFERPAKEFVNIAFDLEDKNCPKCNTKMKKHGSEIPFETFLGLEGERVPDIDLNIPSEFQMWSHEFMKKEFSEGKVFRVGTIMTIAAETAYAIAKKYLEKKSRGKVTVDSGDIKSLANKITGVKKTSGKHAGGVIVIPDEYSINDFTPIQSDKKDKDIKTTHLDVDFLHDNILKFDLLGHKDPSLLRLASKLSGYNALNIELGDKQVISLFSDCKVMKISPSDINGETTGSIGLPEFGTKITRKITKSYKPNSFADLVRISGLSHGRGIWENNVQELLNKNVDVSDVVTCRDDIMNYLKRHNVDNKSSFNIMECIKKNKDISDQQLNILKRHNVPEFYLNMCRKISYLFPKAHAVAYVLMAYRVAYYKLYHPLAFYASYFTTKEKRFPVEESQYSLIEIQKAYQSLSSDFKTLTKLQKESYTDMEILMEAKARKIKFLLPNFKLAPTHEYLVLEKENAIMIPFRALDGFSDKVINNIYEARQERPFTSEADLKERVKFNVNQLKTLRSYNLLEELNQ